MKRILITFLAFTMMLSTSACAAASENDTPEALIAVARARSANSAGDFSDVPDGAWYADSVRYLSGRGVMNGTGENNFSPDDLFTRAQLAAVLHRIAGQPTVTGEDSFTDTEGGAWYSDAVLWAEQNGVIEGVGGSLFGTNSPTTQEQLVTMLWRMDGEPDAAAASDASSYAANAVSWARESGIASGGFTFAPKEEATRAMVAVIVSNYLKRGEDAPNSGISIPTELAEIQQSYFSAASQQGKLEDLYYDTWESFSYEQRSRPLQKHAVVYLPCGYDESKTYDVFYLMHGGWSNENTTLGTPSNPSSFKNVLDNAIQNGEVRPIIVVCPTYNNTNENGQDSDSYSLAMQLTRNYHNELINDLIPAVEEKYSVYSGRNHRGFGGFSMGSVTTWRTFEYALDHFHYFLPMSCGTGLDDAEIWNAAAGYEQSDYFVWIITGTSDFAYSYDTSRANRAKESQYFTEGENFAFHVKNGYSHDNTAAMEYTYNGLRAFFPAQEESMTPKSEPYTRNTKISDVINDPVFGNYGRLLFPTNTGYYSGDTLENLRLTWYSGIDPDKTVEIVNALKSRAERGETIFYDIYTDAEKAADPAKTNTGLFFFKGNEGAKYAICNAGGGFAYVGAMHDSFPHALELSKMGYSAFALIYRPGWETAMEDLGRAISFIKDNAAELGVDPDGYSLWGGSAGARMAATLGNADDLAYYTGRMDIPQAAAIIMQYTGHSEASRADAPTYACVGTSDGIASWRTMQSRLQTLENYGIPTEFHAYNGLPHGFGLGTGTVAEGWINDALAFWEANM